MELSKNIVDGITIAGKEEIIPDAVFNTILGDVFEKALGYKGKEPNVSGVDEKVSYSSLFRLLLEASKHDVHTTTLSSVLEDCYLGTKRITAFINLYQEHKDKIQQQLSLIGHNYDQLIAATWRQDYIIKSSHCEKIGEPSYVISLKTWNSKKNDSGDITFGCSLEELQDLVFKLKDATKCIERNASA